jgi:uncharacterized protein YhaN
MIIVSIRLHPFGKFSDRTFQFDSGVHVVTGPNEFGKSTMSSAIQHVLYTPSGLTPAKLNRTMGMWFPHPGGKNCAVTLVVEEEGVTWTIQKKWGQGDYTLLSGSNAIQLSGEEAEKKISEIVVFNEATWDNVFHTSQAELADTVTELSRNSGNLDDLVASTSASALHDVSPDHFLQAIDRRISEHYSNWDADLKLPRDGRGISKPWKQNVGVVLKAYYDWKNTEALKQEVEDYSVRLDSLQMQRTAHRTTIESLEQFVSEGVQHRAQFMSRTGLESDLLRIEDNLSRQKEVLFSWPSATSNLQNSIKETERLSEALLRLRGEYADAELSARSASMRQAFEALRDARKRLEDEQRALETVRIVSQDAVDSAEGYERIIREADIKIAAHRLSAEIAANRTVSVDVSIGTATAENLQLDAGTSWRNDSIAGTISIAYEGITFTVSSVSDNVQSFLRERQHALQSLQELLAAHTIQTTDELRIAHRDSVARLQIVEEARSFYHHCLAGRSYDEWETQNSSLRSIRSARSLSDINDEMQNLHRQTADHEHTIAECKRQLEQYAALYTDQQSLLSLVTANTSKLESLKQQIAGLPALPNGYGNADEYLADIDAKSQLLASSREALVKIDTEIHMLHTPPSEQSITELTDSVDLQFSAFQRALAQGEALMRIRRVVQDAASTQSVESPLKKLPPVVAGYFTRLTNGAYTDVVMVDKVPTKASGPHLQDFDVSRLSQGTQTSLALATRLAIAQAYLSGRKGVIMFDDPCVDMDAERRAAAMQLLQDISREHQIILFTCH